MSSFSTAAVMGAQNNMATAPRKTINLRTAFIIQAGGQREKRIHVSLCTTSIDKPEGLIAKVESLTRIVSFCESITSRGQSRPKISPRDIFRKGPALSLDGLSAATCAVPL